MNSEEALAWLQTTHLFGVKLGLDNIRRLLTGLGDPQNQLRILHVAGTNGKGSVCAIQDAILRADGRRTGLYTSPHLVDFCERIRVNGAKISPPEMAEGLSEIRSVSGDWEHPPTYFEAATALALWNFARRSCEIVVLETGMGGRLDATNAVQPIVSVLTPIAADHMQWLGTTLEEVAKEKAGIIKPRVPVVSARQEDPAARVIAQQAEKQGSHLRVVEEELDLSLALPGAHQKQNAALAIQSLRVAGLLPEASVVARALQEVRWPGRFQTVANRIVLDGAHNPHAIIHLVQNWQEAHGESRVPVIFGALAEKDFRGMLERLAPIATEFLFVPIAGSRGVEPAELAAQCPFSHRTFDSLAEALAATPGPCVVTGSLYLVGEAMTVLEIEV